MIGFVVDCSVTLTWVFPDEARPDTEAILDRMEQESAIVPALWQLEVANALVIAERRGRVTPAQLQTYVETIESMPVVTDLYTAIFAMSDTMALARRYRLTVYDATYLELVLRKHVPLATLDKELRQAAIALNLEVWPAQI